MRGAQSRSERPSDHRSETLKTVALTVHTVSTGRTFLFSGTFKVKVICSEGPATPSHVILPSYTALKPCALTAKSVVNHKASIDPLLTIGDGSINPDNLGGKDKKRGVSFLFIYEAFWTSAEMKCEWECTVIIHLHYQCYIEIWKVFSR